MHAVLKPKLTDLIGVPGAIMVARHGLGFFYACPGGCNGIGYATFQALDTCCGKCRWKGRLHGREWHPITQESRAHASR